MLNVDKPIDSRKEDFLERKYFSDNVSNAILNYNDENNESLTIGLYGKWGSGKTSIVNMITEKLEVKDDIIIFKFEPWIFSDTQQLISNFFKEFAKSIKYKDYAKEALQIGEELETYATFFEPMSLIPEPTISLLSAMSSKVFSGVGKASKKWGQLKSKNLSSTKNSIEKHLQKLNKKILIIVDDIDRLNNTEIRQVFQMIKVLGNFPNTIYLSSMDKDVVIEALSEVQKGDGSEYLEKIINVPFEVPTISKGDVEKFLFKELDKITSNIKDEDFDKNYWANIFHSGYKFFFFNIRDVVRYMNILHFNYLALENKVNIIDLIAITAFQVFEPKVYELIKNNKDNFAGSLPERSYGGNNKEEIKTFLENLCQELQKISTENCINLLQELFLKINEVYTNTHYVGGTVECRKLAKICSPEFFNTYFTLTLSSNEISSNEMRQYIEKASNEEEFREIIIELNKNNKITKFLEKLQDYTRTDIKEDKFQVIFNTLIDLGDSFPQDRNGMYSISNNWIIGGILSQLLNNLEEEERRYKLIKISIEQSMNSLSIVCFEISGYMQQHGEYEKEAKQEDNLTITNEHLQELKVILKEKIEKWVIQKSLFDHSDALSILYVWKRLDSKSAMLYIQTNISDNENLIKFLQIFISYSYSQSSGDYTTRKNKNYSYDSIRDFLNIEDIIAMVKKINLELYDDTDDLVTFSVESFLRHYDSDIKDKENIK